MFVRQPVQENIEYEECKAIAKRDASLPSLPAHDGFDPRSGADGDEQGSSTPPFAARGEGAWAAGNDGYGGHCSRAGGGEGGSNGHD